VPVVLIIAILAIVAVAVFAAVGRGGQLSVERTDHAPLELGPVSATDVVLLRPPTALWGYNVQATDEAMEQIAESIRERDVRIVALEQLVTDLSRVSAASSYASSPTAGSAAAPPAAAAYADPPPATPEAGRGGPEAGQPASGGSPAPPERSHD
jgi:hypothetical protein